jgi:hypothetical protein
VIWLRRVLTFVMRNYMGGRLIEGARRRGLAAYFRVVNGVRRLLVALVLVNLLVQLVITSFLALIATLAYMFIADEATRLYALAGVFGLTFVVPLLGGMYLLSESFWLKLSGAERLVRPSGE